MTDTPTRIFIQARMSSSRYPGKMLAPFRGQPLIKQVLNRVQMTAPPQPIVILTSDQASDDPLALYVESLGFAVFRGSLDDVLGRFQACLKAHPCEWVFRVSGDSPLFDGTVMTQMLQQRHQNIDLVSNVFPRTFPRGRSVEMINTRSLLSIDSALVTDEEREHVTKVFYNHPDRYRVENIESGNLALAQIDLTVDTLEDLQRLETFDETPLKGAAR
jgi:spore coat polysaccharide biosynthesis protein SpsF